MGGRYPAFRNARHGLKYSKFLRVSALLVCALLLLAAGASLLTALYLKRNPEATAELPARAIREQSGLDCAIGAVDVIFFPFPQLALMDVVLEGPGIRLTSPFVTVLPSPAALLRGAFVIDRIALLRADCSLDAAALAVKKDGTAPAVPVALPPVFEGCDLVLESGSLQLAGPNFSARLEGLNGTITLRSSEPEAALVAERVLVRRGGMSELTLRAARLNLHGLFHDLGGRGTENTNLYFESFLSLPGFFSDLSVTLNLWEQGAQDELRLRARTHGALHLGERELPLRIELSALRRRGEISLEASELALGEDKLRAAGRVEKGALKGRLDIDRLSLPRWFGFGRGILPGIQQGLDALRGFIDFQLNLQMVEATAIEISTARGTRLRGSGGVKSFAEPVIFLNMAGESVNADAEFPELAGKRPAPPAYGHPPLVPEPGAASFSSMPDLGYDIRIRAKEAEGMLFRLQEPSFRCTPGGKGPLLQFTGKSARGGQAQAALALSGGTGPAALYGLKLELRKFDLESLKLAPAGKARLWGRLNGTADLRSGGAGLDAVRAGMGGDFALALEEGSYGASASAKDRMTLPDCALEGNFSPYDEKRRDRISYTGAWSIQAHDKDGEAELRLNGPLSTDKEGFFPLRVASVPGVLRVRAAAHGNRQAEVAGRFTLDTDTAGFTLEEAEGKIFSANVAGHARVAFGKAGPEGQGRISMKGADLRKSLIECGFGDPGFNPALLKSFSLTTAFAVDAAGFSLTEGRGALDQSRFAGALTGQWKARPYLKLALEIDDLPLDAYLKNGQDGKQRSMQPWKTEYLKNFDAEGQIEARHMRLFSLNFTQLRAPLRLNKGVLEFAPIHATLYNGPMTARLKVVAGSPVNIHCAAQAKNVDMAVFSAERGGETLLGGKAAVDAEVSALARSGADIPAALNGSLRFDMRNGALRTLKKDKKSVASTIVLDEMRVSGPLERGVFRTQCALRGPTLNAQGGGRVNLAERNLDVTLDVRMKGLPDFPLRIYGGLDAPQTSIQAGQAVLNALGKLGSGVVGGIGSAGSGLLDVVGGALSAPFRLLKK